MKIEGIINSKEFFIKENEKLLQEGDLIEGEILDVEDNLLLVHIKDLGIIKAKSEKPLYQYEGKTLSFIIKESLPNKIYLKPILENIVQKVPSSYPKNKEEYLINILKEFNIKPSALSIDFLENLIGFNLPINKENLVNGIGILDKLVQLLEVQEDEIIILANSKDEFITAEKEDIRNLLIVKENEKINIPEILKENVNFELKEWMNNFPINKIDKELLNTVIFFIKYNIKPTLNNIKYFTELKEDSILFSKDFEILKEIMNNKFTNFVKKIMINSGDTKSLIEENHSKYKDILNRILDYLKDNSNVNKDIKKDIGELVNKIEFLREMNKELVFVYIPLNLDENIHDTAITLLKKRKKKSGYKDNINMFINLNTENLGNVKIYCLVSNTYIEIKFSGINKEDIYLFKSRENELRVLVEASGYQIGAIEYLPNSNQNILDSLIVNRQAIYNLDVQV
ncbi:hypothetical protein [Clostridium sp. Cult1]|uniref:hypothetical protein n=1 Tax=Clostridium sp. Cult1 TaxID=2079002 RepID=UPI001F23AC29|nr:hypothetical protein [Clostridium sp. Cult1]MCF6463354.1 hypothetical protein [Clostridium sp. Cult1]